MGKGNWGKGSGSKSSEVNFMLPQYNLFFLNF